MKNGIRVSPTDLRREIDAANWELLKPIRAEAKYSEIVKIESECVDKDDDFSSDEVRAAFAVRVLALSATEDVPKKKIIGGTGVGAALDGVAGVVKQLGLTSFQLPLGMLELLIPFAKAEKRDSNAFVLDHTFEFGPDELVDDRNAPNQDDIRAVVVGLRFAGGFFCTDDDGDSFLDASVHIEAEGTAADANLHVWGEPQHDPRPRGTPRLESGHGYYTPTIISNLPRGGIIDEGKAYRFRGNLKFRASTPRKKLRLLLNFGVRVGAESDTTFVVSSNNATSAWFEPFELTLTPVH